MLAVTAAFAAVRGGSGASGRDAPAPLPPQRIAALGPAARAAGCRVVHARYEGNRHSGREFSARDYRTNPPTSGDHNPSWYDDGIYAPGQVRHLGRLVHTLEHGRIDLQYRPGTPRATVRRLEALYRESDGGYHMLLYENTTRMPYAVAATAWTRLLGCRRMNERVFDALRAFRARYIDTGPEQVP